MKAEIEINNNKMIYCGVDLEQIAIEYGTPLKITFLDVIKKRAEELKNSFDEIIKELDYPQKFFYLNANKANYGILEIEEAFMSGDGLETSSYYDLLLTREIFIKNNEKNKYIVCNGYKPKEYLDEIIDLSNQGYKIINIIDSIEEYEYLKNKGINLEVGLRIHLPSMYNEEHEIVKNDRFGLNEVDFKYIVKDMHNTNLNCTTIHFHQRGFQYEEDKFLLNIERVFSHYIWAKTYLNSLCNLDIGGGTPLFVNNDFDYRAWARLLLNKIKAMAKDNKVLEPNIFS